jgi:hypothetical protein
MSDQNPRPEGRSRRRRNVIGSSPHRDEYVRLLKAGWSSLALERYAAFRYGEDIPAQTFRGYRARLKKQGEQVEPYKKVEVDQTIDVIGERANLIRLQRERIKIDWEHEQSMKKLFSSLSREITVLNSLLDSHKADLQDVGVLPKSPDEIRVTTRQEQQAQAPRWMTLGEIVGGLDKETEADLARSLHNVIPLPERGEKTG